MSGQSSSTVWRLTVRRAVGALLALLAIMGVAPATVGAKARKPALGDILVFAHVPYPGNPGGSAVDGRTLWVDTSAANSDRPFDGMR